MFRCVPRLFASLLPILFCKAVTGVGRTFCGVFNDNVSKHKGWGHGGDENKFSAALSRSACDPEKSSTSPEQVQVIFIGISHFLLLNISTPIFDFLKLFFRERTANIAGLFMRDTGVISLARFSAGWTVVM